MRAQVVCECACEDAGQEDRMKYIVLCIVMLSCFAFAGGNSAVSASTPSPSIDEVTVPADQIVDDDGDEATTCGGKVCGKGTYCCNPSCGTCVPKGMSCTQQSCN
jgi:hypothetical protein